jgi:hypothetical protein
MSENSLLLDKVQEIVKVMVKIHDELNTFISQSSTNDANTKIVIGDLQKRLLVIEIESSLIVTQLQKIKEMEIAEALKKIEIANSDLEQLKKPLDVGNSGK